MIARSTDIRSALRSRQRGFFLNPFRFGGGYANTVLADSPALYWRLNEQVGASAADASGHGRVGSYTHDVSALTSTGLLSQDANRAISILGGSSAIGVTRSGFPVPLEESWTVECLIKPVVDTASPPSVGTVFQVGKPSAGDFWPELGVFHWGDGTFGYRVMRTAIALLMLPPERFAYGEKHHALLRYTKSAAIVDLIVNKVVIGSAPANFTPTSAQFNVGYCYIDGGAPSTFFGAIDEVAVYAGALSDSRISSHYAGI